VSILKQVDAWLRDADISVKLAACGDHKSFANASELIQRARRALEASEVVDMDAPIEGVTLADLVGVVGDVVVVKVPE
jgi:hypothetical protein